MVSALSIVLATAPAVRNALAGVHACVLDGGSGRGDSLCGREAYLRNVHSAYGGRRIQSERVFSGDGSNPAPDCTPHLYDPAKAGCAEGVLADGEVSDTNMGDYGLRTRAINSQPPGSSPLTSDFQLNDATGGRSFTQGCLPPRQASAPATDVCHFWSANHGMSGGMITYYGSSGGIRPEGLAAMVEHSSCGTTRFVTNNCYSGAFTEMIFQGGRVKPGVCGASATVRSEVALARIVERGRLSTPGGELVVAEADYTFTRLLSESLAEQKRKGRTPTLDEAFSYAYLNDPHEETPISTSQAYLSRFMEQRGRSGRMEEELLELQCLNRQLGTDPYTATIRSLAATAFGLAGTSGGGGPPLDQAAKSALLKDLENQKRRLTELEGQICLRHYAGECPSAGAATFVRDHYQKGYLDPVSGRTEELVAARREAGAAQKALLDAQQDPLGSQAVDRARQELSVAEAALAQMQKEYQAGWITPDVPLIKTRDALEKAEAALLNARGRAEKRTAEAAVATAKGALEAESARQRQYQEKIDALRKERDEAKRNLTGQEAEREARLEGLRANWQKATQKVAAIEAGISADMDALAPKAGFREAKDDCGKSDGGSAARKSLVRDYERYANLRKMYQATLTLMSSGTQEQVADYLTVKQCEWGDFFAAVPGEPR